MARTKLITMHIRVTPQTAYHLRQMAEFHRYKDLGRVVDKLMRERQQALSIYRED